ncbi:hypothetical protein [Calidithermus roseus]|uniref:Uncharacterized protein n=1 Tax=Calidithermus roseus TaxID=1644118 RepID=A0A399EQK7_9DEIN|nr:hypothetical protein [Calidithermus roseus]RIH85826.1 hypothetical protein Mrose_02054 [Calidithermus roseus]
MHPKREPKLGWRDMLAMVAILYQLILLPVMLVLGGVGLILLLIDFHLR